MSKPTHTITTNVYYIDFNGTYREEAVPAYEMEMEEIMDITIHNPNNFLYIESGTEGWFDGEIFETIEGSNTRLEPEYAKTI